MRFSRLTATPPAWLAAGFWVAIVIYIATAWGAAPEIGHFGDDLAFASESVGNGLRRHVELYGWWRIAKLPLLLTVVQSWVPGHPNALPFGLLLYAVGGLGLGAAFAIASGTRSLSWIVAIATLLLPFATQSYTTVAGAFNFCIAAGVCLLHAFAHRWARSRSAPLFVATFAVSALLSLFTYELSLIFIVGTLLADWWDRPRLDQRRLVLAALAIGVAVGVTYGTQRVRTPKIASASTAAAELRTPGGGIASLVRYAHSRARDGSILYAHVLGEETRRPLQAIAALILGAALGWILPLLIAVAPPERRARILLAACSLGIGVLPALIAIGAVRHVRMEWRALPLSVASLLALAMLLLPMTAPHQLRISRIVVGSVVTLLLLFSSGAVRNIRAACRLPAEQLVAIHPTASRSGIVTIDGIPYHISFAQPICRQR